MTDLDTAAEAMRTEEQYTAKVTGIRRFYKERVGNGLSRVNDEGSLELELSLG